MWMVGTHAHFTLSVVHKAINPILCSTMSITFVPRPYTRSSCPNRTAEGRWRRLFNCTMRIHFGASFRPPAVHTLIMSQPHSRRSVEEIIQLHNENPFWSVIPSDYTRNEINVVRRQFANSPTSGSNWTVWGPMPKEQAMYAAMKYFLTRIDMGLKT
jgi:hypothetical protein